MKRRDFLRAVGRTGGLAVGARLAVFLPPFRPSALPSLLIPMDESQTDHLKAYGLAYRAIQAGLKAEWLLNYRGGAFLLPDGDPIRRDAALNGVLAQPVDGSSVTLLRGEIETSNMDAVPLEKAPKVAVYAPPNAAPWDDAVTMALQYAGIPFTKVWDPEVVMGGLKDFDWLHLHHEDFTGQYSKFFLNYAGSPWLVDMVDRNRAMAKQLGFATVPAEKRAVAVAIAEFVGRGGFLFAMCTATETLDLALAADHVDIAAAYADGTPMDPDASRRMHWELALAFQNAQLDVIGRHVAQECDENVIIVLDRGIHSCGYPRGRKRPQVGPAPNFHPGLVVRWTAGLCGLSLSENAYHRVLHRHVRIPAPAASGPPRSSGRGPGSPGPGRAGRAR